MPGNSARLDVHVFSESNSEIAQILALVTSINQRIIAMSNQLDDAIATLQADDAALKTELSKLSAIVTGFAAELAAAVAAASAAGATPAQLQALTDLHTALQADIATVTAAEAAAPPAPAP